MTAGLTTTPGGVTFRINLAPADYPHARHTLPHQLPQWAAQVDEVMLVTDLHRVRRGHFGEGSDERRAPLSALVQADLDAWLDAYNEQRTHQDKMCCGRIPRDTFDDGMRIWKEKLIGGAAA